MKCAIFEEHSSWCVVYSRFSGTLFPVSMIDGEDDCPFFFIDSGYELFSYELFSFGGL